MKGFIGSLYHTRVLGRLFHTLVYCLQRELKGCQSVLDLGCGRESPLKYCRVAYSVGVDAFEPVLRESRKRGIHSEYILADIAGVKFKPRSFDAVIMIDLLEHLEKAEGEKILRDAEEWARGKVIVNMPVGWIRQGMVQDNRFQAHRSGWQLEEMTQRGYRAYGMAGLHSLRTDEISEDLLGEGVLASVKYRPRCFWFVVLALSQLLAYYIPGKAFEAFYVKILAPHGGGRH
ncbi:MAG: class I SAM-dependent methyltransferase [Candidatus Aureabacteria bacterium]|nr:class I SAM-dependent methyltransferase [Candidatus Auribacterota bacterium]